MAARLPSELIRKIVDECVLLRSQDHIDDGYDRSKKGLTRLAMVNKDWLAVVEPMIWCRISVLMPYEFQYYTKMVSGSSRRRSLIRLTLSSTGFKKNDPVPDDDSTSESSDDSESNEGCEEDGYDVEEEEYFTESSDDSDHDDSDHDDSDHDDGDRDYNYRGDSENWQQWDDVTLTEDHEDLKERADQFFRQIQGLFKGLYIIWQELASWGEDLNVKRLELDLPVGFWGSMLNLLGRGFRAASAVEEHLVGRDWLSNLRDMPELKSVLSFESKCDCDGLWLAIAVCTLCKSLPNLQKLHLVANDKVKTWYYVRKHMREGCFPRTGPVIELILIVLAHKLSNLPASLREVQINMSFYTNINQKAPVPIFLHNGHDQFSCAIRKMSLNLARLIFLFFTAAQEHSHLTPVWPYLKEVSIVTGIENAEGGYWLRPSDTSMFRWTYENMSLDTMTPWTWGEERRLNAIFGNSPSYMSLDRPNPRQFDALAISIARAVSCMPKLHSFTLQFISQRCLDLPYRHRGWGFFLRSSLNMSPPELCPAHEYYWPYVGIDWRKDGIETARTEWVFQCPFKQVQWEEPEEAKALWSLRFPGIKRDIVTLEKKAGVEENQALISQWRRNWDGHKRRLKYKKFPNPPENMPPPPHRSEPWHFPSIVGPAWKDSSDRIHFCPGIREV